MSHNFDDDLTETDYNTAPFYAKYGRIGRMRYLAYTVMLALCALASFMLGLALASLFDENNLMLFSSIPTAIIAVYAKFAPAMRRFNDLNRSSWWAALLLIPLIGFFVILYLTFAAGDEEDNNYGKPAEPPTTLMNIVGVIGFIILMLATFFQFLPK